MKLLQTRLLLCATLCFSFFACNANGDLSAKSPLFTPYIGPYLTLLQPEAVNPDGTVQALDPSSNMVINYELEHRPIDFVAGVRFRKVGANWQWQSEDNYTPSLDLGSKVHHITLRGLSPNTRYEYQIAGPNGTFGQVFAFNTAAKNQDSSRFLVIGDMQDEQKEQRWQQISNAIVQDHLGDFDYIITVGDMVKDDIPEQGERAYWWRVFFNKGEALFATKPIFPALGNHETPPNTNIEGHREYNNNPEDTLSFRKYFYLNTDMSKPDYYSYRFGNACLMSVNSEIPAFYSRYPERDKHQKVKAQYNWLKRSVANTSQCSWSFAYWHIPAINPVGGKSEVKHLRPYTALFNGHLDWSITGHVHQYQRLKPLVADDESLQLKSQYGRKAQQGVGYLIAPAAGQWPKNRESSNADQLAYYPHNEHGAAYEIGFTIVQTQGKNITIKTYGMGGVGTQEQPKGYRVGDDRSKILLDSISYSK